MVSNGTFILQPARHLHIVAAGCFISCAVSACLYTYTSSCCLYVESSGPIASPAREYVKAYTWKKVNATNCTTIPMESYLLYHAHANHVRISSQRVLQALSQAFASFNSLHRDDSLVLPPLNGLHLHLRGNVHRIDVETLMCND